MDYALLSTISTYSRPQLPLCEPSGEYRRDEKPRLRVLLVEDDYLCRKANARALALDYLVVATASAEHALAMFRAGEFDLVLTDYHMALMNGIELLEQLRYRDPSVRRILMSGGDIPGLAGYVAAGIVQHWISKPADLLAELNALLSESARLS